MAIRDIDSHRKSFPTFYRDRDPVIKEDDYLLFPEPDPESLDHPEESIYSPELDIESVLAGILGNQQDEFPIIEPTEEEVGQFGGHPGGLMGGDGTDTNGSTSGIDTLAFYLPFHEFPRWWGIYLFPEGILTVARRLRPLFDRAGLDPRMRVRVSKQILYHHEFYHHMAESFATRLETILNGPCYITGFSDLYRKTKLTPLCREETCANSYARERILARSKNIGVDGSEFRTALNDWFGNQPQGYKQAKETTSGWDRGFRPQFFEDCIREVFGSSYKPKAGDLDAWNAAGYLDRGIADKRTPVSYIIRKGSPLHQRLPANLRTCVKGGNFKQKLKKLKIAKFEKDGKKHELWRPLSDGIAVPNSRLVPIPRHDGVDIPKGTMRGILQQLGYSMSIDEFLSS
jgi:hypothetical protein